MVAIVRSKKKKEISGETKNSKTTTSTSTTTTTSSSSSSSSFWWILSPMFYIGLGIMLYQHYYYNSSTTHPLTLINEVTGSGTVAETSEDCTPTSSSSSATTTSSSSTTTTAISSRNKNHYGSPVKHKFFHNNTQRSSSEMQNEEEDEVDPKKVVFYHVHAAKTAGSSLNRYLARRYYTICGHKGYSIDQPMQVPNEPRWDNNSVWGPDRVHPKYMKELGFHNCKLISHEISAADSIDIIQYLQSLGFYVHLLIPCRDPVSHRISKCAYLGQSVQLWIDRTDDEFCSNIIHRCLVDEDRYSTRIPSIANSTSYYWYTNFSMIDDILSGYVPERGYILPDSTKTYVTNDHFSKKVVYEIISRCGIRIHRHFMKHHPIYQPCANENPRVNEIPSLPSLPS